MQINNSNNFDNNLAFSSRFARDKATKKALKTFTKKYPLETYKVMKKVQCINNNHVLALSLESNQLLIQNRTKKGKNLRLKVSKNQEKFLSNLFKLDEKSCKKIFGVETVNFDKNRYKSFLKRFLRKFNDNPYEYYRQEIINTINDEFDGISPERLGYLQTNIKELCKEEHREKVRYVEGVIDQFYK